MGAGGLNGAMARETKYTANKRVTLTPELEMAIDEFRFREKVKSETEALRRLIEMGLARANETRTPAEMVAEAKALLKKAMDAHLGPIYALSSVMTTSRDPARVLDIAEKLFTDDGQLSGMQRGEEEKI